jgi:hypothetical protein
MGIMYTKNKTLSNYYSVQNAILRTKAFDFTSLLFNGFKASVKNSIIADAYNTQHRIQFAIIDEYRNLVDYNPDPIRLSLSKLADKDTTFSLTPIITTINDLTPYTPKAPDTAKAALLTNKNDLIEGYNNKVRLFNSHLKEINSLVKQLDQTNSDITKLLASRNDSKYPASSSNANGMLSEIVVSNKIVRKE